MADPVLSGVIRVQAVLQGISALPEDRYITTWAFSSDAASTDAGKAAAIAKVRNFYVNNTTYGGNIASKLAGSTINETLSTLRAYDLGQPVGQRVPYVEPFTGLVLNTVAAMPSEVAVCASYYAGFNQRGLRGRVYLGPLNTNASTSSATAPTRVNNDFMLDIRAGLDAMASVTAFPRWCIISRGFPTGAPIARVITGGWVDNAFDTQRRRGEDATVRHTWLTGDGI